MLPIVPALKYAANYLGVLFTLGFNSLLIQVFQWPAAICWPLIPRALYLRYMKWTQRAFVDVLLLLSYGFAPTDIILTGDYLPGERGFGGDAGVDVDQQQLAISVGSSGTSKPPTPLRSRSAQSNRPPADQDFLNSNKERLLSSGGGDDEISPESVMLIANHQTYADWLYLWCFAHACNADGLLKIILKHSLQFIPIIGWGMRCFEFMFIRRNWPVDQKYLAACMDRLSKDLEPVWLLIFPEGTVFAHNTKSKSMDFAQKNGLTAPNHVLLPRSTGMNFCLQHLKSDVTAVYDITMGYEGIAPGEIPEEKYTLRSMYISKLQPKAIHFHIRRYPISEIPFSDDAETDVHHPFSQWLYKMYQEKDVLMDRFYANGAFDLGARQKARVIPVGTDGRMFGREYILFKMWLIAGFILAIILLLQ